LLNINLNDELYVIALHTKHNLKVRIDIMSLLKQTLKILSILIISIILVIFILFIVHKIKSNQEYQYLKNEKYINLINIGNYKLNIYKYGNESSSHKIIGIAGKGVNDFSVEMSYSLKDLDKDNQIIFIDRAGYGYSDDTKTKQTVEQVVNDYRNALKKAGIEAPYILMPHSLGGVYATYWESMYPNEIEGVIYIDTTELGIDVWAKEDRSVSYIDKMGVIASKLGLQRPFIHNYYYKLPNNYSEKDQKISDVLNTKSTITNAKLSETEEINSNTNKAFNSIVENDIPKIYIDASSGFTTIEELKESSSWLKERQQEVGIQVEEESTTDAQLQKALESNENWRKTKVIPYIEKLGNTKLILLPGNHQIFEEKPRELNTIIKEFMKELNK
jgi:pimeloyl-ACP methyl ester carboxylesterase